MATPRQYEVKEAATVAMNALNAATGAILDADIAPLTTTTQLAALFNRTGKRWNQGTDIMFHRRSIEFAIAAAIFTDANVAAANTMDGLRLILTTAFPSLTNSFQSGRRAWT
jgi:hypothetical protein